MIEHKRKLANIYFKLLPNWIKLPSKNNDEFDVFHIFCVSFYKRDMLKKWLKQNKIMTEIHYPIAPHKQESLKNIFKSEYPISESLHASVLSLPISKWHFNFECRKSM